MTANASWTKNTLETYTAELYKSINQLAEPLGAVGTILKGFTPVMERSTSALDEFTKLSEAYSHMVHDELTPAKRSMEDLASSARGLSQLIAALRELMGHLEVSTSQSLEINKSLDFTLRARATPTVEVLQRATGTFETRRTDSPTVPRGSNLACRICSPRCLASPDRRSPTRHLHHNRSKRAKQANMRSNSYIRAIDTATVGWISTADIFILSTFFLFILCATYAAKSKNTAILAGQLASLEAKNQELGASLEAAQKLVEAFDHSKSQAEKLDQEQKRLNNELLGLGGSLRHVAILVDISRSMKSGATSKIGENSWRKTKGIIRRWIQNLDVGEAALIVFGDRAKIMLPMQTMDAQHRESIVATMETIEPNDESTNFLAAFELAYSQKELDTIIVFSDGLPTIDLNGEKIEGPRLRQPDESPDIYEIYRNEVIQMNVKRVLEVHRSMQSLAKRYPRVAINAIGLGDRVYTAQTGNLLNDLALRNGGVFIAIPSN